MAQGKISGFAWHVEKRGYKNEKSRNCFNCINYDEHWCRKHDTSITSNNARNCNFFENVNKPQVETIKTRMVNPGEIKELSIMLKQLNETGHIIKAEYGCTVKLQNRKTMQIKEIFLTKEEGRRAPKIMRRCIGKFRGNYFECQNEIYQIIDIYKV